MDRDSRVTIDDVASGNVGFFIAQALLDALIRRKVIAAGDVAPMLQEVVDVYRQPAEADRVALNASMANVLTSILSRYPAK